MYGYVRTVVCRPAFHFVNGLVMVENDFRSMVQRIVIGICTHTERETTYLLFVFLSKKWMGWRANSQTNTLSSLGENVCLRWVHIYVSRRETQHRNDLRSNRTDSRMRTWVDRPFFYMHACSVCVIKEWRRRWVDRVLRGLRSQPPRK